MKKCNFIILFLLLTFQLFAQQKIVCSGVVRDKTTGEVLIAAFVQEITTQNADFTNEQGRFSLFVNSPAQLEISYVGYEPVVISIAARHDTIVHVQLETNNTLDVVQVVAMREHKPNVSHLSAHELTHIPALGAKPDVLKTAQLLPGIQAQNEGSSLLVVRGGDPGQNLYLLDNVPLIYVNHLGGFTSVFNPDMIHAIDIYKGSFPAQYGGKLSSILHITQRAGNAHKVRGTYSVGVSDVSFTVEGPTKLKNSQFIVSGRKTVLPDVFLLLASTISRGNDSRFSYGFHDVNAKYSWHINSHNTMALNLYHGDDYMNYWGKPKYDEAFRYKNAWGNSLASVSWTNTSFPKLQSTHILSHVYYRSVADLHFTNRPDSESSKIHTKNLSSKAQSLAQSLWKYSATQWWNIDFGVQASFDRYVPDFTYNSLLHTQEKHTVLYGSEANLYIDNSFSLFKALKIKPGIRLQHNIITNYSHSNFEPRLQFSYALSKQHSISAHYMQVHQNSHMLFTNGEIMSNEIWIPASKSLPPSRSQQYSLAWNGTLQQQMYATEVAVYYKEMFDLLAFQDGYTSIRGDEFWEQKLAKNGRGTSYGFELFVRKQRGDWQGFAGYSYSHTDRKFDVINNGKSYTFDYDRPHSFSISVMRTLSNSWSLGATWVFQSGLPYTPVVGRYYGMYADTYGVAEGLITEPYVYDVLKYGERNSERMRAYHRLDIGATYRTKNKHNNSCEWNFSVYNVYNRKNPYYYYYNHNNSGEFYTPQYQNEIGFAPLKLYQISFFPIIPTVSYKVIFDGENYSQNKVARQQKREKAKERTFLERFNAWMFYED